MRATWANLFWKEEYSSSAFVEFDTSKIIPCYNDVIVEAILI